MIPKILIAVLTTYERHGWPHPDILKWVTDLPRDDRYATLVTTIHNFSPAAAGRNVFCKMASEEGMGWDWLCMVDNDMAPPANLLDTLKGVPADADIVVPTFYLWDQTQGRLALCWSSDELEKEVSLTPGSSKTLENRFYELTKCGTGVIFIKAKSLRKLSYPYFKYLYNADQGMAATEDIQFCLKAREAGLKIYGNPMIRVGHFHSVDLNTLNLLLCNTKFSIDKSNPVSIGSKTTAEASPAETVAACPANQ